MTVLSSSRCIWRASVRHQRRLRLSRTIPRKHQKLLIHSSFRSQSPQHQRYDDFACVVWTSLQTPVKRHWAANNGFVVNFDGVNLLSDFGVHKLCFDWLRVLHVLNWLLLPVLCLVLARCKLHSSVGLFAPFFFVGSSCRLL